MCTKNVRNLIESKGMDKIFVGGETNSECRRKFQEGGHDEEIRTFI